MFDFSPDPRFLVRVPRKRWMRLFPWLRLYYCTQRKTTRLCFRARVDAACAEHMEQQLDTARRSASQACAQPLPKASSENKEISMPSEKSISDESVHLHTDGRQIAVPPVLSKQRHATRRIRASMQYGRLRGSGEKPYESALPSAGARVHLVVRLEVKNLSGRIAKKGIDGKRQEHRIYF